MTPLVLVHGNPEIAAIWDPRSLPWTATRSGSRRPASARRCRRVRADAEAYRDWLIGELEAIGEPVDLVGHDWGGAHVVRRRHDAARS